MQERTFSLPFNKTLEGEFNSEQHARHLIWCLSMLYGARLAVYPNEFVDAANIKNLHQLGFCVEKKSDLLEVMSFLHKDYARIQQYSKNISSAIHLMFLSLNPYSFEYEKFSNLYMAIDSCYRILNSQGILNAKNQKERLQLMAEFAEFNDANFITTYYKTRNDLFHEGLYVNNPAGYAVAGINFSSFINYISRILFKILNINFENAKELHPEQRQLVGLRLLR